MSLSSAASFRSSASRRSFLTLGGGLVASMALGAKSAPAAKLDFIDNGTVRVGIKPQSGAGIAWISASGSKENLVDHYDHGRLVQQSYYGKEDGSTWGDKPWRWNPVQGGDWQGSSAKVLAFKKGHTWLEATTLPKHWASGQDIKEVTMKQRIDLDGPLIRVHYEMDYTGTITHPPYHQEIPAFFVPARLDTLALYDGDKPWTQAPLVKSQPGWPNEYRTPTEKWAAYVGPDNRGIGAYVPEMELITCYRYGVGSLDPSACSYFAPLKTFAITPGLKFRYECVITMGHLDEIRGRFQGLAHPDQAPSGA